jgi:hypothetical protein
MCWKYLLTRFLPGFNIQAATTLKLIANLALINLEAEDEDEADAYADADAGVNVDVDACAEPMANASYLMKDLTGFSDVVFVDSKVKIANKNPSDILAVGELKKPFDKLNGAAYAQKDQLLIQLEAIRQMTKGKKNLIKGFLTDLFVLNIAMVSSEDKDKVPNVYFAPRVVDAESYFVRLLFLLCDLSREEFREVVGDASSTDPHPDRRRSERIAAKYQPQVDSNILNRTTSNLPAEKGKGKGKGKGNKNSKGYKQNEYKGKGEHVFDYKRADIIEFFEERKREQAEWEAAINNEPYLSEAALRGLGESYHLLRMNA